MPNFDFSPFVAFAEEHKIFLPTQAIEQLNLYGELLLQWNEKINLTAITEKKEIVEKHFMDSASLLTKFSPQKEKTLLDVGTGAGFPGLVLKILYPDLSVTLLDGHAKRFLFLKDVEQALGIQTTHLHARAELLSKEKKYRESFDIVTARAVASLPQLAEYCLPFVKVGGSFLAMKGPGAKEEGKAAESALSLLGGSSPQYDMVSLPSDQSRVIVMVKKIATTPQKYPRASGQIKKKPL